MSVSENSDTVRVIAQAMLTVPKGSDSGAGLDPTLVLPDGRKIKFWVQAELHESGCEPRNLTYDELLELGVLLEPDGGEVVGA
jgi:hypothetical protein